MDTWSVRWTRRLAGRRLRAATRAEAGRARCWRWALCVAISGLVLALGGPGGPGAPALAQELGLTPDWGAGTLTVRGAGFRPGERVTLTARVGPGPVGQEQTFSVTADAQGRFTINTGMQVPAGSSVRLEARGDQGTGMAAVTSAPALPLGPPDVDSGTGGAGGAGARLLLAGAVAALVAGLAGWRLARRLAGGAGRRPS
jgi:hypothetical protein